MGEVVKVTACHQEPGDGGEENSKESWWDGSVRKLNKVNGVTREVPNISPTSETQAGISEQRKREGDEEPKEQGAQLAV